MSNTNLFGPPPPLHVVMRRLCRRLALKQTETPLVLAARRLLGAGPIPENARQWLDDLRLMVDAAWRISPDQSRYLSTLTEQAAAIRLEDLLVGGPILELAFTGLRILGVAIRAQDWTKARQVWERMSPIHPMAIAHDPSLEHLATLLRQMELLAQPPLNGIH